MFIGKETERKEQAREDAFDDVFSMEQSYENDENEC